MVHWPDDPVPRIERIADIARGDTANVSTIAMSLHTGTHMDPPLHYLRDGASLDRMPLDVGIGPARVVEIRDASIEADALLSHDIQAGERVLFKTSNSTRCWGTDTFVADYVAIHPSAARYLVQRRVQLVGIDYLSIGPYSGEGDETHRILLEGGVWIVEGLDLSRVAPGAYDLVCLPILIADSDGAPARAILRRR